MLENDVRKLQTKFHWPWANSKGEKLKIERISKNFQKISFWLSKVEISKNKIGPRKLYGSCKQNFIGLGLIVPEKSLKLREF